MELECHSCGESFPSRFYFAAPGLCKTCVGDATPRHEGNGVWAAERPLILDRRFWLQAGAVVFVVGTFLMAIIQLAMAIGGTLLFGTAGSAEGAGVFIIGLFNVIVTLAVGLPIAAIFFTLRAWDDRFRAADGSTA